MPTFQRATSDLVSIVKSYGADVTFSVSLSTTAATEFLGGCRFSSR